MLIIIRHFFTVTVVGFFNTMKYIYMHTILVVPG
jgi:hypothetical protein